MNVPVIVNRVNIVVLNFTSALVVNRRDAGRLTTTDFIGGVFALTVVFTAKFSCKLAPVMKDLFKQKRARMIKQVLGGDLFTGALLTMLLALVV